MKALVLTCDRYRLMTDHMIMLYERLWPDHPFRFRIPFQKLGGPQNPGSREYVSSPPDIRGTVLKLVEDLDDEEWVYWCIDDKYPIELALDEIKPIVEWINSPSSSQASGVLFCRCRGMLRPQNLNGDSITDKSSRRYLERSGYSQIWLHQFLRAKVIRHLFAGFPSDIPAPKMMDDLKKQVEKPADHHLYVTERNLAVMGESTSRGLLTVNCHQSIRDSGMALGEWEGRVGAKTLIMGDLRGGGLLSRAFQKIQALVGA